MQKSPTTKILVCCAAMIGTVSSRTTPSICMLSPSPTIMAGDNLTASVENPQGRPCAATLVFSDQDFLPVTYSLPPITCLGTQQAEIVVPLEAPNGLVTILWECADDQGSQSCSQGMIEGGSGDLSALIAQQQGIIGCIQPISTITTLSTVIQGTSTVATSVVETISGTSFGTETSTAVKIEGGKSSQSTSPSTSPTSNSSTSTSPTATSPTSTSPTSTSPTSTSPAVTSLTAKSPTSTSSDGAPSNTGIAGSSLITTIVPVGNLMASLTSSSGTQCSCTENSSASVSEAASRTN